MAGGPGNVVIRIAADTAGAVKDINKVTSALGDQMTKGDKASAALKKAVVPATAAFAAASAVVVDFTKAAAEDADSQAVLAKSLVRTTGATEDQIKASEDYIAAMSAATGVTDDEMRPALAKLAAATGSAAKGQEQLGLAVDIAAHANVSLEQATAAVVQADQGRAKGLAKLVPGIDQATIKSKDQTKILEEAAKLTSGAAAAGAETYGGQMEIMATQIGEAEEAIGAAFLPVLEDMLPVMKKGTDFISDHTRAFSLLLTAVLAISGAIIAANFAMKAYQSVTTVVKAATAAWTAAQWLLNVALNANPIGLVIAAVTALVGALILAWKNSETFRQIVTKLWDLLKGFISAVLSPLERAWDRVSDAIDQVQKLLKSPFVTKGIDAVTSAVKACVDLVSRLVGWFKDLVSISFDGLIGGIRDVVNWIQKIDFPDMPGWLKPGKGKGKAGGPAGAGVGAYGSPAAFYPAGRAAGGNGLTINVYGAIDPEGTARQIRRLLEGHDRRQGRTA